MASWRLSGSGWAIRPVCQPRRFARRRDSGLGLTLRWTCPRCGYVVLVVGTGGGIGLWLVRVEVHRLAGVAGLAPQPPRPVT